MFLVTLINPHNCKYIRKVFHDIRDAEDYIDYLADRNVQALELALVTFELSEAFCSG